jgi:polysaccharide export outer membrane protein
MPVRSRGSLLAGTAALAGLIVAGFGCHSSYSDHDSFAIPNTPAQPGGGLLSRRSITTMQAGYPAQPVVQYDSAPSFNPAARPVTLQPVPISQTPVYKREVIASSWSPVQRVSAEQTVQGPDLRIATPIAPVSNARSSPPVAYAPGSQMPIGSPMPSGNGPVLDGSDTVSPGGIVLPPPRPLGSPVPVVIPDGAMPDAHPYANVPREFEKMALPPYVVEPPDILLIQASNRITLRLQPIQGQHLVGPDGTINLGIYGKVRVAGMTLDQVADVVAARLLEIMPGLLRGVPEIDDKGQEKKGTEGAYVKEWQRDFNALELIKKELQVDVLVYSSKFYYVITDGGGYGQQVYPIPIRGNETVLDALANINGLPAVANKRRVWVARATRAGQAPKILPVDWMAITKCGESATNYQLFPGDRVYVDSNNLIKADSFLAKLYSPILRTFGVTLLGASTVNTIKLGTTSGVGAGLGGLIR